MKQKYKGVSITLELQLCGSQVRICAVNLTAFMLADSSKRTIHGMGFAFVFSLC